MKKVIKNHKRSLIIGTSLSLSLFVILNFILAGEIWYWNIFSFLPSFSFLLIALFAVAIGFRTIRKLDKKPFTYFAFTLFAIGVFTAAIQSDINPFFFAFREDSTQDAVSIFNWNTQFWEEDEIERDIFYDFIASQNADIINLQEHFSETDLSQIDDIDKLKELFPEHEVIATGEFVILSKLPVVNTLSSRSSYTRVDLDVNGDIVSLYNVHIPVQIDLSRKYTDRSFVDDMRYRFNWRKSEFKKLELDINNNPNQKIIAGDFNTTTAMNSMRDLLSKFQDSTDSSGKILPISWRLFDKGLWRIDYVLFDDNFEIILHEDIPSRGFSDHNGQKVFFKSKD